MEIQAATEDVFYYDTNGVSTITITGYEGSASELVIPDTIDGYTVTKIGAGVFQQNTNLSTVTLPSSLVSIGNSAFYECTNLKSIVIPDSVTAIGSYAFRGCSRLEEVKLPSNLTTLEAETFRNCVALSSITIPKTLVTYNNYLVYGPFEGCTHLYTATLEEGATTVCDSLFRGSAVETVSLPSTLRTIEQYAFYNCTNLKSIYFSCNAPTIVNNSFNSVTATAYYPANNSTWNSNVRQNYGGSLTWTTWSPAITPAPVTPAPTATAKPTASPAATASPTVSPTVNPTVAPTATETVSNTQTTISNTTVSNVTASTAKKKVTLRWKKKAGVSGYQIYRKTGSGSYTLVKTINKAKTVKWTDRFVKRGKTYYYKIRAYRVESGITSYSKFSSVKKVKVK